MRLTPEQIRETVAAMRLPELLRAALLERALGGKGDARFVVYAAWRARRRLPC